MTSKIASTTATVSNSTLTKAEIVDLLFEKVGLNKTEGKRMVESFYEEISDQLERGDSVKLSGFGNFEVRDKPARPGRNPKTGETSPLLQDEWSLSIQVRS